MTEEQHIPHREKHIKPNIKTNTKPLVIFLGLVVLCGLSFYGGVSFERGHKKSSSAAGLNATNAQNFRQFGNRRFSGQRPVRGQVTAVSATSITVKDEMSGTSTTYGITSSTKITNNGQTAAASEIQSGDTVAVIASGSSSTTASQILINPTFGGGPEMGAQSQSDTNSSQL